MAQSPSDVVELVRMVRQIRQYKPDPVPKDAVDRLLEVARWTGSARKPLSDIVHEERW